jgi:hypothetical protein
MIPENPVFILESLHHHHRTPDSNPFETLLIHGAPPFSESRQRGILHKNICGLVKPVVLLHVPGAGSRLGIWHCIPSCTARHEWLWWHAVFYLFASRMFRLSLNIPILKIECDAKLTTPYGG